MRTPWGQTSALRKARLRPGAQLDSREKVDEHQRARVFGWLVATVAQEGYPAARAGRLTAESGVGPGEFYKLFDNVQECLLAAVGEILQNLLDEMLSPIHCLRPGMDPLASALMTMAREVYDQPAAAKTALVGAYEVGEPGRKLVDDTLMQIERQLADHLAQSAKRSQLPPALPGAIVGAGQMLLYDRLSRNMEDEVVSLALQMTDWIHGYKTPRKPLARSRTHLRPARRPPEPDAGVRLLYAMADLCQRKGYCNVRVDDLAVEAKTSLRVLYQRYGGKQRCFSECFELVRARTMEQTLAAYRPLARNWPRALHAAIGAIMRYFAREPAFARLITIEVFSAGRAAFEQRDEAIRSFAILLEAGYRHPRAKARLALEAVPFGVYGLVYRHLSRGQPAATLPQLTPTATYFALAPAIGSSRAAKVANEPVS